MLKAKVMNINSLQLEKLWSGQTIVNLVNMVKKSQSTECGKPQVATPCRQKVEGHILHLRPSACSAGKGLFSP
jgi:hypothetical protein